jgi:non-specific serine/threonine protein kinase/serine/threonine-protein kinase
MNLSGLFCGEVRNGDGLLRKPCNLSLRRDFVSDDKTKGPGSGNEPDIADDETLDLQSPSVKASSQRIPEAIGSYRVLSKLGEGGMGVVYEVEQQSPRRLVALKVIRGGHFVDDAQVRMFQREAETLARLKHPHIGAIYESGNTEDGQHFFAMELVRGQTLDQYLAGRDATLSETEIRFRLRLFRMICDAVHYAHQRGVIHRDLKPTNIVVTDEETSFSGSGSAVSSMPAIKILDFGLARIVDSDMQGPTLVTEVGVIKGTLPYMSPEQARGDAEAIDMRTDVYALGVILYEMLAGTRPHNLEKAVLLEAVHVICEDPPVPLRSASQHLQKIDRDVETIAGKALEKDPERRYTSAAALSEDVERYLSLQPIVARPPSATYQLQKLVARHRMTAGFAGAFLVLLVVFGIGMTVLYGQSTANLKRAIAAEESSRQNFDLARGAVDRYLTRVGDSPELKVQGLEDLRQQLLGTARDFYEDLAQRQVGQTNLGGALANSHQRLADISRSVGDQERAEEEYRLGLEIMTDLVEIEPSNKSYLRNQAAIVSNLGLVIAETNRLTEADVEYNRALVLEEEFLELDPTDAIMLAQHGNTLDSLGQLLEKVGRGEEAEQRQRQSFVIRKTLADEVPDDLDHLNTVLQSGINLSSLYARQGRLSEAKQVLQQTTPHGETLMIAQPRNAEFRHSLAAAFGNLGGVEMLLEDLGASAEAYEREIQLREPLVLDHPAVLDYRLKLASTYTNLGELAVREERYDDSLPWFDKAIETLEWVLERESRHATARYFLSYTYSWNARAFDAMGRYQEATAQWEEAIRYDDRDDPELRKARDRSRLAG